MSQPVFPPDGTSLDPVLIESEASFEGHSVPEPGLIPLDARVADNSAPHDSSVYADPTNQGDT